MSNIIKSEGWKYYEQEWFNTHGSWPDWGDYAVDGSGYIRIKIKNENNVTIGRRFVISGVIRAARDKSSNPNILYYPLVSDNGEGDKCASCLIEIPKENNTIHGTQIHILGVKSNSNYDYIINTHEFEIKLVKLMRARHEVNYGSRMPRLPPFFPITSLADGAFEGQTNLKEIKFNTPNIIKIGTSAFNNTGITKLELPNTIGKLQDGLSELAFTNNPRLIEVILPDDIHEIPVGCFSECVSLEKINLHNLRAIRRHAFKDTAIINIHISSNTKTIEADVFSRSNESRRVAIDFWSRFEDYSNTLDSSLNDAHGDLIPWMKTHLHNGYHYALIQSINYNIQFDLPIYSIEDTSWNNSRNWQYENVWLMNNTLVNYSDISYADDVSGNWPDGISKDFIQIPQNSEGTIDDVTGPNYRLAHVNFTIQNFPFIDNSFAKSGGIFDTISDLSDNIASEYGDYSTVYNNGWVYWLRNQIETSIQRRQEVINYQNQTSNAVFQELSGNDLIAYYYPAQGGFINIENNSDSFYETRIKIPETVVFSYDDDVEIIEYDSSVSISGDLGPNRYYPYTTYNPGSNSLPDPSSNERDGINQGGILSIRDPSRGRILENIIQLTYDVINKNNIVFLIGKNKLYDTKIFINGRNEPLPNIKRGTTTEFSRSERDDLGVSFTTPYLEPASNIKNLVLVHTALIALTDERSQRALTKTFSIIMFLAQQYNAVALASYVSLDEYDISNNDISGVNNSNWPFGSHSLFHPASFWLGNNGGPYVCSSDASNIFPEPRPYSANDISNSLGMYSILSRRQKNISSKNIRTSYSNRDDISYLNSSITSGMGVYSTRAAVNQLIWTDDIELGNDHMIIKFFARYPDYERNESVFSSGDASPPPNYIPRALDASVNLGGMGITFSAYTINPIDLQSQCGVYLNRYSSFNDYNNMIDPFLDPSFIRSNSNGGWISDTASYESMQDFMDNSGGHIQGANSYPYVYNIIIDSEPLNDTSNNQYPTLSPTYRLKDTNIWRFHWNDVKTFPAIQAYADIQAEYDYGGANYTPPDDPSEMGDTMGPVIDYDATASPIWWEVIALGASLWNISVAEWVIPTYLRNIIKFIIPPYCNETDNSYNTTYISCLNSFKGQIIFNPSANQSVQGSRGSNITQSELESELANSSGSDWPPIGAFIPRNTANVIWAPDENVFRSGAEISFQWERPHISLRFSHYITDGKKIRSLGQYIETTGTPMGMWGGVPHENTINTILYNNDKDTDYVIQYPAYDYIGIHPPEKNYAISELVGPADQWGEYSHIDILGDHPFQMMWVTGDNSDALQIDPIVDYPILEREIYFGLTPNMNYDVSYVINIIQNITDILDDGSFGHFINSNAASYNAPLQNIDIVEFTRNYVVDENLISIIANGQYVVNINQQTTSTIYTEDICNNGTNMILGYTYNEPSNEIFYYKSDISWSDNELPDIPLARQKINFIYNPIGNEFDPSRSNIIDMVDIEHNSFLSYMRTNHPGQY